MNKWFLEIRNNMDKTMKEYVIGGVANALMVLMLFGCVSTSYQLDIPQKGVPSASVKYSLQSVSGAGATASNITKAIRDSGLGQYFSTSEGVSALPLEIMVREHDIVKDGGGLSTLLWLCTVGIFPAFDAENGTYDVTVKTPAGERSDSFTINRKTWMGWIPMFVGYPCIADKRDASMKYEPGDLVYEGVAKTATSLAGTIDYSAYLSQRTKLAEERKIEVARIETRKSEIKSLLDQKKWDEVVAECNKELTARAMRSGNSKSDDEIWKGLKSCAQIEIDRRVEAEAAKRAEEERAIAKEANEAARTEIKRLTDSELFDEALALCRKHSQESKKAKDRRFWDDMATSVRTERKIAEKKAEKAKAAEIKAEKERKLIVAQQQFEKQLKELDEKIKSAIEKEGFAEAKNYVDATELPQELLGIESFVEKLASKKTQLVAMIQQAEAKQLGKKADAIDVEALIQHVDGYMTSIPSQSDLRNIASWYRSRLCALKAGQLKSIADKNSLLVGAVLLRERKLVSWVLDNGGSSDAISEKDSLARPAMIFASANGDVDTLNLLASRGANIDAKSARGVTSVMAACGAGQEVSFDWLHGKGANIGEKDNDGMTTLMYAAGGGSVKIVLALVSKGADVNQRYENKIGTLTALVYAIAGKKTVLVERLIELGADPNMARNSKGENIALRAAIETEDFAVLRALFTSNAKGRAVSVKNEDLVFAVRKTGQTAIVKTLLENGASADTDGLLAAVLCGKTEIVDLLCKNGADVNGMTKEFEELDCKSILEVAIKKKDIEMVKTLVGLGADVSKVNVRNVGVDQSIRDFLISKGAQY